MAELKDVRGIGPKSLSLLNKININTIEDLVTHYPFRYDYLERNELSKVEIELSNSRETYNKSVLKYNNEYLIIPTKFFQNYRYKKQYLLLQNLFMALYKDGGMWHGGVKDITIF